MCRRPAAGSREAAVTMAMLTSATLAAAQPPSEAPDTGKPLDARETPRTPSRLFGKLPAAWGVAVVQHECIRAAMHRQTIAG